MARGLSFTSVAAVSERSQPCLRAFFQTYQGEEEPPSPKRRRMETRQFKGPAVEALPEAATVRMAAASCSGDGVFARGHVPVGSFSRLLAELREESIEQGITPEMAMEFYNRQIMDGWVAAPLSPADCSPVDRLTPCQIVVPAARTLEPSNSELRSAPPWRP